LALAWASVDAYFFNSLKFLEQVPTQVLKRFRQKFVELERAGGIQGGLHGFAELNGAP
jgi:hypothetical protein